MDPSMLHQDLKCLLCICCHIIVIAVYCMCIVAYSDRWFFLAPTLRFTFECRNNSLVVYDIMDEGLVTVANSDTEMSVKC